MLTKLDTLLVSLMTAFPRAEINKATLKVYAKALAGIDEQVLEAAVARGLRSWRFFPTIAEIIEQCHALEDAMAEPPSVEDAWAWVVKGMSCSGVGVDSTGYEIAARVVRIMGGWSMLGMGEVSQREWRRKEFVSTYRSLLEQRKDGRYLSDQETQLLDGPVAPRIQEVIRKALPGQMEIRPRA